MGTTLIEIPQWGDVTLLELIWTVIGGLTVFFTALMLRIVWCAYVVTEGHDERRIARQYVRREFVRLIQGLLVLGAGLYVTLQAPPAPGPAFITPGGIVILSTIYLLAVLVVVQSIGDYIDRFGLINELEKGDTGILKKVAAQTFPKREDE